jgi:hypothetical protein
MTLTKLVALRLGQEQAAKLVNLSAASGIPVSELIRACITRALPYVDSKIAERLVSPQTSNDTQ